MRQVTVFNFERNNYKDEADGPQVLISCSTLFFIHAKGTGNPCIIFDAVLLFDEPLPN
jgi:hypothetical protein